MLQLFLASWFLRRLLKIFLYMLFKAIFIIDSLHIVDTQVLLRGDNFIGIAFISTVIILTIIMCIMYLLTFDAFVFNIEHCVITNYVGKGFLSFQNLCLIPLFTPACSSFDALSINSCLKKSTTTFNMQVCHISSVSCKVYNTAARCCQFSWIARFLQIDGHIFSGFTSLFKY